MSNTTIDRIRGINSGIAIKAPCRVRTTANITLSGLQTIDGVTLVADDRVLVVSQSTQSQNGIYKASTGSWVREPDFDGNRDIVNGTLVYVTAGSVYAESLWVVTSANPITIGTTSITFDRATIDPGGVFSGTGYVKVLNDAYQTPSATIPLGDLATQAANTVIANATASTAAPSAVSVSASRLFGRGSTGNITGLECAGGLEVSGTNVQVANAGITLAKIQNATASSRIIGSGSAGSGSSYSEITLGTGLSMSGTTINAVGGAVSFLGQRVASNSATLDFTSLMSSSYDSYIFDIIDLRPATDNTDLYVRTSTDNGSTYDSGVGSYGARIESSIYTASTAPTITAGTNTFITLCQGVGNAAAEGVTGKMILMGANSTTRAHPVNFDGMYNDTSGVLNMARTVGYRISGADIDAVRFYYSSGNITSGTINLYGIRNS